jgi:hypothetical protein
LTGFFVLLLVCFVYSHHRGLGGGTALSRLDLLHALVARGTFAIDGRHEKNTPDKAFYKGHYYSDKAPGTAALALPAFCAGAWTARLAGVDPESKDGWLWTSWAACAGSVAPMAALGAVALFVWLSRRVAHRAAFVTTAALFLGAAPWPYATMLFSHAAVAGLLAVALWAFDGPEGRAGRAARGRDFLGGFACGLALASEYTAGIVVAGLVARAGARRLASLAPALAGMVPPMLLVPAYSWVCLGHAWQLPYSYQASFPEMQAGLYAIQWPNASVGWRLLFSPARGLVFWTPFLLLAAPGYAALFRRWRGLFWLAYACVAAQIVVMSGREWDWGAGPTYSARYLTPLLPLLALPCALGLVRYPRVGLALAVWSVLAASVATLTDACPELRLHPNPLFDLQLPLLVRGDLSPNLGRLLGFSPVGSLELFYGGLVSGAIILWRRLPMGTVQAAAVRPAQAGPAREGSSDSPPAAEARWATGFAPSEEGATGS